MKHKVFAVIAALVCLSVGSIQQSAKADMDPTSAKTSTSTTETGMTARDGDPQDFPPFCIKVWFITVWCSNWW